MVPLPDGNNSRSAVSQSSQSRPCTPPRCRNNSYARLAMTAWLGRETLDAAGTARDGSLRDLALFRDVGVAIVTSFKRG
jgi:hypothetical protein